jgi:transcriptional regulator NrdR family protein
MFVCEYCKKEFSTKGILTSHQKSTKYCLILQGKSIREDFKCQYCIKKFTTQSNLNDHLLICKEKPIKEYEEKLYNESKIRDHFVKTIDEQILKNNQLNTELTETKKMLENKEEKIVLLNQIISKLETKLERYETRMYDMASRQTVNTTNNNNNNKTVVVNMNLPLTNEVLRQCATTFTIDNARTITGITKHLTSSLEDHIICTDPSRNIFKYTNEKDEEIIDQDLENLIPQYLTAVKDRNNFLYDEVCKYFTENNIPLNVQTDYAVFYNALNSIIEKKGQQSKYTEKCKQRMVRECRKQFLEKNKNKEKEIAKKMTEEEVMMMVIESGGSVNEFIDKIFPNRDIDEDDDELFNYRRKLEDKFILKKREWKKLHINC